MPEEPFQKQRMNNNSDVLDKAPGQMFKLSVQKSHFFQFLITRIV